MADPFPDYATDDFANDPFSAFVMTEFHAPDVEAKVRAEELAAIPFQVECGFPHGGMTRDGRMEPLYPEPCPDCGACL